MRTTVDLPEELMRAAKARAAERGESLKDLFARAVAHEIRLRGGRRTDQRVALPLVGGDGPAVDVTNADVEAVLAAEDADRYRGR
jgi:hypothetical protein